MGRKELIVLFYTKKKKKERFDLQKFFFFALWNDA